MMKQNFQHLETQRFLIKEENCKQDSRRNSADQDEDFVPLNFKLDQNQGVQKKKRRPRECYKLWDTQENKIFLQFLTSNKPNFQDLVSRRANKVFVNMSKLFPQRNSHQCKSHYQKLQKMTKNKTVSQVIKYLQKKLKQEKVFQQKVLKVFQKNRKKTRELETGRLNIFFLKDKFFEIQIHINPDLIESW